MREHILNIETLGEEQTVRLGVAIGRTVRPGDVILLRGALGAGKTRVAKGIVSAATGTPHDDVVSPTFTLVNTFEGPFAVHHADFYRLGPEDVDDLGLAEALLDGALVVEWPDNARQAWEDPLAIHIDRAEERGRRKIRLSWGPNGRWKSRLNGLGSRDLLAGDNAPEQVS